jgi:photosystem II stability/assembly factor-like uncharacterized protein
MDKAGSSTDAGSGTGERKGPGGSRGRALITAACVCVLLAGCGAAAAAGDGTAATRPVSAATAATAATAAVAATAATAARAVNPDEYLNMVDLAGAGFGLVGLGTGGQGTGRARLVASADFGRSFTAIGPQTAAGTVTDDVFFLSRKDGWYAAFNINTGDETLYRTTDGGRTWSASAAPEHAFASFDTGDLLQFLTPARGWLTDTQGTGPGETLYATTDGGAHWRLVATTRPQSHGPGVLPDLGQVRFEPGGKVGWLGGGVCSAPLYRTTDGGREWQRSGIPAPAGAAVGLPIGSGQTLLEPVTLGNGTLVLYRTTDGGTRWSRVSALPGAVTGAAGCGASTVSVSFPSAQDGWAAAAHGAHGAHGARTVVYRTTDGGRHWELTGAALPGSQAGTEVAPVIQATDATHAWLLTPGGQLYATVNSGETWRRINTAAIAAGS